MKILHYALGFPPYRTGGLTRFCMDIMKIQKELGHDVSLLWPGRIQKLGANPSFKKHKECNGIKSIEMVNPLPVPLDEGILEIDLFTQQVDEKVYINFFEQEKPDAIHIHTLMGIHKEAIEAANKLNIKIVFTSHDYFGLCPKVTFYRAGSICEDKDCSYCRECNKNALSIKKIKMLQTPLYRVMKNNVVIKYLRKRHRSNFFEEDISKDYNLEESIKYSSDYQKLRQYYVDILEMVDCIHYNSNISKSVYERYITPKQSKVIPITHSQIVDKRVEKNFNHEVLKIVYLGPTKSFKGFNFLLSVLDYIWNKGKTNFELSIFDLFNDSRPYISNMQKGYSQSDLDGILNEADLVVVPSQWYETFGFTALEAWSHGVPVMVSNKVGAKEIVIAKENGLLFGTKDEAIEIISKIIDDRSILDKANKRILKEEWQSSLEILNKQLLECYNI